MGFSTKLQLSNEKFEQLSGQTLTLLGTAEFSGTTRLDVATIASSFSYETDQSGVYDSRSIPDVGFLTGETSALSDDITFVSGATDDNTADIAFLDTFSGDTVADLAFVSGATDTNTDDIGFLGTFSADTVADLTFVSGATDDNTADIANLASISGSTVLGAENGLSINSSNDYVRLGGALTGDTTIDTNNTYGLTIGNGSSAVGNNAVAFGYSTEAYGNNAVAGGQGVSTKEVFSCGGASFNHSTNTAAQTIGHGALADNSAILGGRNHNIELGNTRAAIIGGDTIKLTGSSYIDFTAVDNLAIFTTPTDNPTGDLLVWDSGSKKVGKTTLSAFGGLTGATNGLSTDGQDVKLGGTLIEATSVLGAGYAFDLGTAGSKLSSFDLISSGASTIQAIGGLDIINTTSDEIVIDAQTNSQLVMKSQSGSVGGDTFTNAIGFNLDFTNNTFTVVDNRALQKGIEYLTDYSANYTNRSLVDKAYVDAVATGNDPKDAVIAATTGNIDLTGGTFGGTLDGVTISDENRVLVKDQTDASENGIYVYSASSQTFYRSEDFDGTPAGEVTQGAFTLVVSGSTQANTQWIVTTPDPITVGTTDIDWTLFYQQLDIQSGTGITVTTNNSIRKVNVELAPDAGLDFDASADSGRLRVDPNFGGLGLTLASGVLDVNISDVAATGNEIPVQIDSGGTNILYIDSADINTELGAISAATNGLTKLGQTVVLGGTLTGDTTIGGANNFDLNLTSLDSFALSFDNGATITDNNANPAGLQYASDYSVDYSIRSLVDAEYVTGLTSALDTRVTQNESDIANLGVISGLTNNAITGVTNGLTKVGLNDAKLGGLLTENTTINQGSAYSLNTCSVNGTCTNQTIINPAGNATPFCAYGYDSATSFQPTVEIDNTLARLGFTCSTCTGGFNAYASSAQACSVKQFVSDGTNNSTVTTDFTKLQLDFKSGNIDNSFAITSGDSRWIVETSAGTGEVASIFLEQTGITLRDEIYLFGARYDADYSASGSTDPRWIPDAGWVTGQTSTAGIQTANNGLTKEGTNVRLGGTLTGDTKVETSGNGIGFGNSLTVSGDDSFAVGFASKATGTRSIAMGFGSCGYGTNSVGIGHLSRACGDSSVSLGYSTHACGNYSIAMAGSCSIGLRSVSIGSDSKACGNNSISIGRLASSIGSCSISIGSSTSVGSLVTESVVLGKSIAVTASTLSDNVVVSDLAIFNTPASGTTSDEVLVWNSTDKKVKKVAGSELGDANNIYDITQVTGATTLDGTEYVVLAQMSGGSYTVTLPATPTTGQAFKIKDKGDALTNTLTISGNGNNIDGAATASINTDYGALELVFDGIEWFSLAFIN